MKTQEVWKLHAEDIKYFILSMVKDATITDDLLQETFIKVHTKLNTLKDDAKIKPWLFSIARYTVLDYFKKQNIVYESTDNDFVEEEKQEHTEIDCLHGIIKSLPKKYRDPLFLSDIKGLKQAEVAKQLKIELSTAKSQIQRARKMVAQGFKDCCGFVENEKGVLVGELQEKKDCKVCNY